MCGCASSARTRASRRKRSTPPRVSSFRATGAPDSRSIARYTAPIPPAPASLSISKRFATRVPGCTGAIIESGSERVHTPTAVGAADILVPVCARLLRLLLAAIALTLCCACGDGTGEVQPLSQWSLVTASGLRRPVALPASFSPDELGPSRLIPLETAVRVPPSWHGRPLTLAVTMFPSPLALFANGRPVPCSPLGAARVCRVDEAVGDACDVVLRLELDGRVVPRLAVVPTLSPTREGDAGFLSVVRFNLACGVGVAAIASFATLIWTVIFVFDRRRPAHGWLALASAPIAVVALMPLRTLPSSSEWLARAMLVFPATIPRFAYVGFVHA